MTALDANIEASKNGIILEGNINNNSMDILILKIQEAICKGAFGIKVRYIKDIDIRNELNHNGYELIDFTYEQMGAFINNITSKELRESYHTTIVRWQAVK